MKRYHALKCTITSVLTVQKHMWETGVNLVADVMWSMQQFPYIYLSY